MKKKKKPFDVLRGDVFYADLGSEEDVVGSEQFGVRPILVTQSNDQNEKSPTIIVAIITSQIKKEKTKVFQNSPWSAVSSEGPSISKDCSATAAHSIKKP